jgi:hypothetical protein
LRSGPVDLPLELVEPWLRQVRHSGIVTLREVFASRELGDQPAVYFVSDYHPAAVTLEAKFLTQTGSPIHEAVLWSFTVQLVAALKAYALTRFFCALALTLTVASFLQHPRGWSCLPRGASL